MTCSDPKLELKSFQRAVPQNCSNDGTKSLHCYTGRNLGPERASDQSEVTQQSSDGLPVVSAGSPGPPALGSGLCGARAWWWQGLGCSWSLLTLLLPVFSSGLSPLSSSSPGSFLLPEPLDLVYKSPCESGGIWGNLEEKPGEHLGLTHSPWNPGVIV